ncbi:hypothetical protein RvY_18117 [Ramazzottius varieornatus]|uniref:N-acetylglucosamine-6-phosphate deacetylase n=1 Tax=Ramazzottius varieornatus TaxID=947166 RepID=A0A1D1W571_RAMVA|nr:hypothetical protein RvY_18117 [Ramazzottius varieornatus]
MKKQKGAVVRMRDCRILREGRIIKEDLWIRNGHIIDPEVLFFEERRSADISVDCLFLIAPGFIDIQINGGFGVDFSSCTEDSIEEAIALVRKRLVAYGVTAFCPTIITSSPALYHQLLPHIKRSEGGLHGAEILGIHLEGPFISKDKKGAHRLELVRQDLDGGMSELEETYGSLKETAIITIAPELRGCMEAIRYLSQRGIVVSLGHSGADIVLAQEAVRNGARCMTHLFNAMPPFHHRDPGMIGLIAQAKAAPALGQGCLKALASDLTSASAAQEDVVYFGLIADGVHTHTASLKIAYRAHPKGAILVTDAISAMGMPVGRHNLAGVEIEVTGDTAHIAGTNTLCGSVATMDRCVRSFLTATQCSLVEALEVASLHPAQLLGLDRRKGTLAFGADADFVVLDQDLEVLATFIAGQCVWRRDEERTRHFVSTL